MDTNDRKYIGQGIEILYNRSRCTHYTECLMRLPQVFNTSEKPWIKPDQAPADEIARVILRCPTGALHFNRTDGGQAEIPAPINTIRTEEDGPFYVEGNITIVDEMGNVLLKDTRVALCRCGQSANKPYCDNSHLFSDFDDDGGNFAPGVDGAENAGGEVQILSKEKGSYRISGQFEVYAANGNKVFSGTEAKLCKCGHSLTKPFCDSTHKSLGL